MNVSFPSRQVVFLSSVDWDAAWQRHHIFASQWAAKDHEVFFLENTGFRAPGMADLPRLRRRLARLLYRGPSQAGMARAPQGLRLVSPAVLPPIPGPGRALNRWLLVPALVRRLRALGLRAQPLIFAYLPSPTTLDILDELKAGFVVYDCVDNFHGLPFKPQDLGRIESGLLSRSDLVLTTSRTLWEDKADKHSNVLELHHGAGPGFFLPPGKTDYRRFCYFGTVWSALDYQPIKALAEAGFSIDLIGPQKEPPPSLPERVRLLPPLPYHELPAKLSEYDGLLLPYAFNEYNRGVLPAKFYDCLATGKPVLASRLPAIELFSEAVYLARTPDEWVRAARGLEQSETPRRREARVALARENTHERMFSKLSSWIGNLWQAKIKRDSRESRQ
ncbi:MAG: hypothetical protein HY549_05325 [Elusimicrobia bacterium]|nr:hypothetical protein [Elusimicrobiota bacterium]